jgi:protease-4
MKKFLLGVLVGVLLLIMLVVGGGIALVSQFGGGSKELSGSYLLELSWADTLPGHQVDPMEAGMDAPVVLSTLSDALRQAAKDPLIAGVLIEKNLGINREYLQELKEPLLELRKAGKPIFAHLELGAGSGYLLAAAADQLSISASSAGGVSYTGPVLGSFYMREALDKLGIRMHVLHEGEAKGYGEQYTLNEMSPAVRENLLALMEAYYELDLRWLSEMRDVELARLKSELEREDRLFFTPSQALKAGLVDRLESRDAWLSNLDEQFPDAKRISLSDWIGHLHPMEPFAHSVEINPEDHVAVLWAEGAIQPGKNKSGQIAIHSISMMEQIRELKEAESVKGVILRVESPGGSALACEEIFRALGELAKSKPLWTSMGRVAASGGYYISLPAETIYLNPSTVVGSIGVVGMIPELGELYSKLGLHYQQFGLTPMGNLSQAGDSFTPAQLDQISASMGIVYQEFRDHVADRRPVNPEEYKIWAEGRVFAGLKGIELKLADRAGTLEDCLLAFQTEKELTGLPVEHYPRQKNLFDQILSGELNPRDLLPGASLAGRAEELVEEAGRSIELDPSTQLRMEWPFKLID